MKFWITLFSALLITPSHYSFAFESDDTFGYHDESNLEEMATPIFMTKQSDATRFQKFEAALETLGIPPESTPDFSNFVHANEVNQNDVLMNAQWLDPDKGLARYLSIVNGNLQLFRDFFKSMISLDYLEYQQMLSTSTPSYDSSKLMQRLKTVAMQTKSNSNLPLLGLKVLIDPGHMGGDNWDTYTGKYVSVNGQKVSEGNLNLWTSLLTAQKLEKLGATVKLTRDRKGPVSTENPVTFDIAPHRNHYFYNSMDDWMAPYLEKSIDQVRATIKNASEVKRAYSDIQRMQFFITGADLEARSKIIDDFNPDITLDIHFDASKNDSLQNTSQSLEAFVPGAFYKNEIGSRKVKALALKHLLEVRRWNQSVEFADEVTQSMSSALKIPRLNSPSAYNATRVRDGVYARNLYINRRALSGLVIYLECLHYDHVTEHNNLTILDRTGSYRTTDTRQKTVIDSASFLSETPQRSIRTLAFQYPNRLDTISDSIENGFIEYFKKLEL